MPKTSNVKTYSHTYIDLYTMQYVYFTFPLQLRITIRLFVR